MVPPFHKTIDPLVIHSKHIVGVGKEMGDEGRGEVKQVGGVAVMRSHKEGFSGIMVLTLYM